MQRGGNSGNACLTSYHDHAASVNEVEFHPTGTCLASASTDNTIRLYDIRSDTLIQLFPNAGGRFKSSHGTGGVGSISFHHSGNYLLSCSMGNENNVNIWDLREGRLLHAIQSAHSTRKHDHRATGCVAFCSDGTRFASGGVDNRVLVWNIALRNTMGGEETSTSKEPFPKKNQRPASAPSTTQVGWTKSCHVPRGRSQESQLSAPVEITNNSFVEVDDVGVADSASRRDASFEVSYPPTEDFQVSTDPGSSHSTLHHIVKQLDLLTQTLELLDMRLSAQENNMGQLMTASLHSFQPQNLKRPSESSSDQSNGPLNECDKIPSV